MQRRYVVEVHTLEISMCNLTNHFYLNLVLEIKKNVMVIRFIEYCQYLAEGAVH